MFTRPTRSRQWRVNHNFIVKVSIWVTYDNIHIIIAIKSVYKANAIVFPQPQVCNLEAALVKAFTSFRDYLYTFMRILNLFTMVTLSVYAEQK